MMRKKYMLDLAKKHLLKSMQMLETNAKCKDSSSLEDYSLFVYRQTAPAFQDRVRDLELKLFYPVRQFACIVICVMFMAKA
jgi:hypothetical protein